MANSVECKSAFDELKVLINTKSSDIADEEFHKAKIRKRLTHEVLKFVDAESGTLFHVVAKQGEKSRLVLEAFNLIEEAGHVNPDARRITLGAETVILGTGPPPADSLCLKSIFEKCIYVKGSFPTSSKVSALHLAVKNGFDLFAAVILEFCPGSDVLKLKDNAGNTPIHYAVKFRKVSVEVLATMLRQMDHSEPKYSQNKSGQTPLHTMCYDEFETEREEHIEMFRTVTESYTDRLLTQTDNTGFSALHLLCTGHKPEELSGDRSLPCTQRFDILLQKSCLLNQTTSDDYERTPLHLLAISRSLSLMKKLLACNSIKVTSRDKSGRMAIHYAASNASDITSRMCLNHLCNWKKMEPILQEEFAVQGDEVAERFRQYLLMFTTNRFIKGDELNIDVDSNIERASALTLACYSKAESAVTAIIQNMIDAYPTYLTWFRFHPGMEWDDMLEGVVEDPRVHSLIPVYDYAPAALKLLFDDSVTIDLENSNAQTLYLEAKTLIITGLIGPINESKASSELRSFKNAHEWPEKDRPKLALHPLTQIFLAAAEEELFLFLHVWSIFNAVEVILYLSFFFNMNPLNVCPSSTALVLAKSLFVFWLACTGKCLIVIAHAIRKNNWFKLLWYDIFSTMVIGCALWSPVVYDPWLQWQVWLDQLSKQLGIILMGVQFLKVLSVISVTFGEINSYLKEVIFRTLKSVHVVVVILVVACFVFGVRHLTWSRGVSNMSILAAGDPGFVEIFTDALESGNCSDTKFQSDAVRRACQVSDYEAWTLPVKVFCLAVICCLGLIGFVQGMAVDVVLSMNREMEMYRTLEMIDRINEFQKFIFALEAFLAEISAKCDREFSCDWLSTQLVTYYRGRSRVIGRRDTIKIRIPRTDNISIKERYLETRRKCKAPWEVSCENHVYNNGNSLPAALKRECFKRYDEICGRMEEADLQDIEYVGVEESNVSNIMEVENREVNGE